MFSTVALNCVPEICDMLVFELSREITQKQGNIPKLVCKYFIKLE